MRQPQIPNDPSAASIGTCLRLIQCREDTPRVVPDDSQRAAFAAWQRARQDVFDEWTYETDPANLQPRLSKLSWTVADFLRKYPPPGVEQARLKRCLEAVEAPCSRREENQLRAVFEADYSGRQARALAVLKEVERLGLEPFRAPQPLAPIRPDEIHLICWLAIEAEKR